MQDYLSVAETAQKFNISSRRVQILCEQGRIDNALRISGVWLIPASAQKPQDGRKNKPSGGEQLSLFDVESDEVTEDFLSFDEVCNCLSISQATGRNWIKLNKLAPAKKEGKKLFFLRNEIDKTLNAISSGELNVLNRRRNKKKVNGVYLYESYIASQHNISIVNDIIAGFGGDITPVFLRSILACFALRFICSEVKEYQRNALADYLDGNIGIGFYCALIDDLLGDTSEIIQTVDLDCSVFNLTPKYIEDEDTLGFVYISLVNISEKKAAGTYYTPMSVVNTLVSYLVDTFDISHKKIFDPCCGSGNFLLNIGAYSTSPELLYGQDIDLTAIQLARISFALRYKIEDADFLYSHFTCGNTLSTKPNSSFDIVLGNPPWGSELTPTQLEVLSNMYQIVTKRGTEIYDVFTECSLSLLADRGLLAFVLPEAILNVNSHSKIRELLLRDCNFKFVHYLGNVFSGVQCPAIILGVEKSCDKVVGVDKVYSNKESYSIQSNRQMTTARFNFHVKDEIQDCLDAISELPNAFTLANNARFALGIVTGDNATYTSSTCGDGFEPVLKGSDIKKYRFSPNGSYIKFIPQKFQQVAPTELYRAPEKLLYRFICETLVFAYDNHQMLSLNSCNVLIPTIPNISVKYILAILNSRIANFYFLNKFNSVKVLRSHIEQIPIPTASYAEQKHVLGLVDRLLEDNSNITRFYDELDNYVMSLYQLQTKERETINSALANHNLFLD